jgi:site-specific DNA recombinase
MMTPDGFARTIPIGRLTAAAAKGVIHSPSKQPVSQGDRNALLIAIAKARAWISHLSEGRIASFAEIARREGKVERHIRWLAPLAFVSPQPVLDIFEGTTRPLAVTRFAKHLPDCGRRQAQLL